MTYPVTVSNLGFNADSYTCRVTSGYPATVLDATCTTPLTTTPTRRRRATAPTCACGSSVPAGAANGDGQHGHGQGDVGRQPGGERHGRRSRRSPSRSTRCSSTTTPTPRSTRSRSTQAALTAAGVPFSTWDLGADANCHRTTSRAQERRVVHRATAIPARCCPTRRARRRSSTAAAGCSCPGRTSSTRRPGRPPFVHDYLHIQWDGTETQNDKATASGARRRRQPVTDGIGAVPLDHSVLEADVRGPGHADQRRDGGVHR